MPQCKLKVSSLCSLAFRLNVWTLLVLCGQPTASFDCGALVAGLLDICWPFGKHVHAFLFSA
ncbi:hypothetical protein MPTK1_6g14580 [Marchantia polymorpha subsp. ruderalis]|uniref:Secreted protein n=2 Tax=Marchantia polymorpha TaxID=3197 RepID=A0AAF6BS12_MARPO|nr:hypothetical protein MARPO_0047s0114 [Marchantia polymorpha]PTQ39143.1 hypothetical protein MARPO_0047s0114 [Marchantia polymorpha]BBN14796.1 hypothetical protein Mp_6g14580 [Marchantia polymorpha subsp. ruderalis]BBN14797.1 hypothetical protein Mp_6g14580 [Marchantia polymorpha subsp. ruderalis]|eukprot:PTQ39142.1 hypothetical protein MARPO_0047s0114 [Marchantia polymorpha]